MSTPQRQPIANDVLARMVDTARKLRDERRRPDETEEQTRERQRIEEETVDKVLGRSAYVKKLIKALEGPKRDMRFTERMQLGAIMVLMDRMIPGSEDIGYAIRRARAFYHPNWQRVESIQRMCAFRDRWHVKPNENEDLQSLFPGATMTPSKRSDDGVGRDGLGGGGPQQEPGI